jgi:hypothetical protein
LGSLRIENARFMRLAFVNSTKMTAMSKATFFSLMLLIPCALRAETKAAPKNIVASGTITVTQEKGRAVFSNDGPPVSAGKSLGEKSLSGKALGEKSESETPSRNTSARDVNEALAPQVRLMYWSNTEHRYKPVPHATPMAMKAAKSAVAEVDEYVGSNPEVVNPNAGLVRYQATPAEVDDAIEQAARRHNVDANLVRALIRVESNFNSKAVSRKGAMGLMQLMPGTARQLKVSNPFDPGQNVDAGVRHLKKLLQDFHGNVKLSLAAYNAGEGAVQRNAGIPRYAETRNYVSRITALYNSGDISPFRGMRGPRYEPMKVFRDSQGVLTFTNTD